MTGGGATVRDARPGDADAVFVLAGVLARSSTPRREAFDAVFSRVTVDDAADLLVATRDDRVVGYLLGFAHPAFFANGDVGWIEELAVAEDVRRRGVATALVAAFEQRTRGRGGVLVALATSRAGAFYAAVGYEHDAAYYRRYLWG